MAELITLKTKTRGRNTREVPYQGLGISTRDEQTGEENVETKGVLTSPEEAMALPLVGNDVQKFLDIFVVGYNKVAREAALDVDEFASYILPEWDEKKVDAFKRSVRAFAKAAELEISEAADFISSKMKEKVAAQ